MGPKQLALVSILAASSAGKPVFFIAGIVNTPVAATFPGPEPDKADMKVETATATYPAPPGNRPTNERTISITC